MLRLLQILCINNNTTEMLLKVALNTITLTPYVLIHIFREEADSVYTGTSNTMRPKNCDITCPTEWSCPSVRTDTTKSSLRVDTSTKVHAWVTSTLICI
jgi:hypothetical protein